MSMIRCGPSGNLYILFPQCVINRDNTQAENAWVLAAREIDEDPQTSALAMVEARLSRIAFRMIESNYSSCDEVATEQLCILDWVDWDLKCKNHCAINFEINPNLKSYYFIQIIIPCR